jgi:hypothetical protein
MARLYVLDKLLGDETRIHLKNVDQGSGQGAGWSAVAKAMAGQAKKRSIHGSM